MASTLEACILLIDNSEYSRNSDYPPSRLSALRDAAHLLGTATLDRNPEALVGLIPAAAGPGAVEAGTLSLTDDLGVFFAAVASLRSGGVLDVERGVARAALALKQRYVSLSLSLSLFIPILEFFLLTHSLSLSLSPFVVKTSHFDNESSSLPPLPPSPTTNPLDAVSKNWAKN